MIKQRSLLKLTWLLTLICMSTDVTAFFQEPDSFYLKSVKIKGQTNVNRFHLSYNPHQTSELTLPGESIPADQISFRIPVEGFESKNPMLTKDFTRFMQAGAHPYIRVVIKKSQLHKLIRGENSRSLPLQISMAGKTQRVESRYHTRHYPGNQLLIEGSVRVNLEHFNLEPPQKMMGLVQVQDKIFINFDVVLSSQQTALKE